MAGESLIETAKYSLLENFSVDIKVEDEEGNEEEEERVFSLCFWVYLFDSTTFPATIIRQVHKDMSFSAPFLVLNENKKMMLLPLLLLHEEAPDPVNTASWTEVPNVTTRTDFPLEKWVQVGCEVARNHLRLYINGEVIGEQPLISLMNKETALDFPKLITLFSVGGDGYSVKGYIQNAEVLPRGVLVKDHYLKDPPLQLSVDSLSTSEIEVDEDGVWSIVGGKASCRRIFSLDVVLSNSIGQLVNKDVEVVASLLYADSGTPVEKTSEAEASLLTTYDGNEVAAGDRPSRFSHGRASFKLKISQLSSKCDNRLFCIKFEIPKVKGYPFLETVSNLIRCISRTRNVRTNPSNVKRMEPAVHSSRGIPSFGLNQGLLELQPSFTLQKRVRLSHESMPRAEQLDQECNSYAMASKQLKNVNGSSLLWRPRDNEEAENSSTGSDNTEARDLVSRGYTISDSTIFQYCLGNLMERSLILKEIANNSSDEEISGFADQVSLYSGCYHHSCQIKMARELIVEGTKAWTLMSQNGQHVLWDNLVFEIEEQFMRIAQCHTRSLTQQDLELLRRIGGCTDHYLTQENFEKLWCWLFPVAVTISRDWIKELWSSTSPKWIEGFITKDEAEISLQGQDPGTFIIRFPSSRSWPHPDSGSLVVSYVGHDYSLRHRLLSIDHAWSSNDEQMEMRTLQDVLMAEPELSRLGRIIRSH